eukprot:6599272-Pyramimonas_sp.AAC.1
MTVTTPNEKQLHCRCSWKFTLRAWSGSSHQVIINGRRLLRPSSSAKVGSQANARAWLHLLPSGAVGMLRRS